MKQLLDIISTEINKQNSYDLSLKVSNRYIYLNTKIYEEITMVLVFSLDTGNWFKETLRFEIVITSFDNNIYYKTGYGDPFLNCQKKDFNKIISFIKKEIFLFINNRTENTLKKII